MKTLASKFGSKQDIIFMTQALRQAQRAFMRDEVPVGAVVVDAQGTLIGRGMNAVESCSSQTEHAEHRAIAQAGKKLGDWRLEGCWLYVTLEPCAMCMNLIMLSRLEGIVFAASSPLFGYHIDSDLAIRLYKNGAISIVEGVCQEQAAQLLKQFFKIKRKNKEVDFEAQSPRNKTDIIKT